MALLELVSYGAEDVRLTTEPQISFFVPDNQYKRYTNFASEHKELYFDTTPIFGNRSTIEIFRGGDLLDKCYLKIILDNPNCSLEGLDFIESVEIEIGGLRIARYEKDYMNIRNNLYQTDEKKKMQKILMGGKGMKERIIPLILFFNINELPLPLIAIKFHAVRLHIEFAECNTANIESASINYKYIHLDTEERRKFIKTEYEYLIEQVQSYHEIIDLGTPMGMKYFRETEIFDSRNSVMIGRVFNDIYLKKHILSFIEEENDIEEKKNDKEIDIFNKQIKLPFYHPCKELYWVIKPVNEKTYSDLIDESEITINGHSRVKNNSRYFTILQQYEHHTNYMENVNMYSFALKPEEKQPSGTINLSRIDNSILNLHFDETKIKHNQYEIIVYATSYNVLMVMDGVSGLSNIS